MAVRDILSGLHHRDVGYADGGKVGYDEGNEEVKPNKTTDAARRYAEQKMLKDAQPKKGMDNVTKADNIPGTNAPRPKANDYAKEGKKRAEDAKKEAAKKEAEEMTLKNYKPRPTGKQQKEIDERNNPEKIAQKITPVYSPKLTVDELKAYDAATAGKGGVPDWMKKNVEYASKTLPDYLAAKKLGVNPELQQKFEAFLKRLQSSGSKVERQLYLDLIAQIPAPELGAAPSAVTAAEGGLIGFAEGGEVDDDGDEIRGSEDASEGAGEVNEIDADSIIDAFLEENPDLAELPVEEWPEEAIKELQEVINGEGVDEPNGVLPEDEDEEGEPEQSAIDALEEPVEEPTEDEPPVDVPAVEDDEDVAIEEPTTDEPNDDQDFDILALSKLVEAGDKDGAWDMLQTMFGIRPAAGEESSPTNALDRMVASDSRIKQPSNSSNSLAKILGSLRF